MSNKSGINPITDHYVLDLARSETVSGGGIIIPVTHAKRKDMEMMRGVVVAKGELCHVDCDLSPEVGQMVIFRMHEGYDFKGTDGGDYRVLNSEAIMGVLDNE